MSNMHQAQQKIFNWLQLNRFEYCSSLQSGLTEKQIEDEVKELRFKLPQEFYQLYQWKNGSPLESTGSFSIYFFPGYLFLPLENIKKEYYQNIDIFDEAWHKNWFPLFCLEGYSYFMICQDKSVNTSSIWFYDYEQPEPTFCYDSLTAMMLTIAECYETGAYYLNNEGCLEENETKVARIKRKYNSALARLSLDELKSEITLASLTELSGNLIEFKNPEAVDPLIQILQSSTESINPEEQAGIKALVARILGEIGDSRAVLPLIKILCDEEYLTRYWTIISLGKLKDSRATLHLINLLQNSHQEVQKIAIWALGEIKDIGAIEPLTKLVSETIDPNIRQAAQDALLKIGRC